MDFAPLIEKKADRFRELESEISAPNLYDDPRKARETLREHTRLKELLTNWAALQKARTEIYADQAEFLRKLHAEQTARAEAAKSTSDNTLAGIRKSLGDEAAAARQNLASQADQLASQIADSVLAPSTRRPS